MSTAIEKCSLGSAAPPHRPIFWRFVWKEFRMLRGLWLAVIILGVVVQCAEKLLLPPSSNIALTLFDTALASAVLYAAGAAATSFSVEHEEETYELLVCLPATWWPVFASKVLVTAVTAALLAVALSIAGLPLNGLSTLSAADASAALGMLGFAILEAVAWGTFFSLLIKRPLLAAIMTLVVGIAVINVAVDYTSTNVEASLTPAAYVEAIPLRLAIVVAVFACSLIAARGWLTVGARPAISGRLRKFDPRANYLHRKLAGIQRIDSTARGGLRLRMVARLLWQTWRESWKLLLFPLIAGVLLMIGFSAAAGIAMLNSAVMGYVVGPTLLFVPALYGAMAFYADQRRGNYRFLAEHAAGPRYVWLARQAVWLGSLAAVWILVAGVFTIAIARRLGRENSQLLDAYFIWDTYAFGNARRVLFDLTESIRSSTSRAGLVACGALVAYAVGQLCSMALRSEILAAFIALLLSTVVVTWIAIVNAWQLSAWLFLLPLFAGFMLATWFRVPDWIAGRSSLRSWWKPALAIAFPIVLVAVALPSARLAQIPSGLIDRNIPYQVGHENNQFAMLVELDHFRKLDTPAARETADMYIKAADHVNALGWDLLAQWEKPEYSESAPGENYFGIDESKIPPDQLEAFRTAKKKQLEQMRMEHADANALAIKASQRPACYFDFAAQMTGIKPAERNQHVELLNSIPLYVKLNELLDGIAVEPSRSAGLLFRFTESFDRYRAALRMSAQMRNGQPSIIFIDQLEWEQHILNWIGGWDAQQGRTKAELLDAIEKLKVEFRDSPRPETALLADHVLVRKVLTGKDLPLILAQTPIPLGDYLAYLANDLPSERKRALLALDRITLRNIQSVSELVRQVADTQPRELGANTLHRWLRPRYGALPPLWEMEEPAATTSYLASLEFKARASLSEICRAYCDNETYRRATFLRLALAAYRLDHKKYPPRLDDLVPQYLDRLPLDPYSQQPFAYEPTGLALTIAYPDIQPNTPVFWSVGPGNARLKQVHSTRYEAADTSQPESEAQETSESFYRLTDEEPGWWDDRGLVFPLPK